jgi:pheromone shutdown protein TraB
MLEAYRLSVENNVPVFLVDDDIENVLKNVSKKVTFFEKFRLIGDILFFSLFPKKYSKKYGLEKIDLSKVPPEELISKLIFEMRKRYPGLYSALVFDRNILMSRRIYSLMKKNSLVLAVVGAGHEKEIVDLIDERFKKNVDVI